MTKGYSQFKTRRHHMVTFRMFSTNRGQTGQF